MLFVGFAATPDTRACLYLTLNCFRLGIPDFSCGLKHKATSGLFICITNVYYVTLPLTLTVSTEGLIYYINIHLLFPRQHRSQLQNLQSRKDHTTACSM